jgi:hypothetical protein
MQSQVHYLPLVKAVEAATGRRPHLSTILRWCQYGSRGIRLESWVLGGRRLTTVEAVKNYMEAVTAASVGGLAPPVETPNQASKRAERAAKELRSRLK